MYRQQVWEYRSLSYRQPLQQELADCIEKCTSVAVVGFPGMGKSTLLESMVTEPLWSKRVAPNSSFNLVPLVLDPARLQDTLAGSLYPHILELLYDARGRFENPLCQQTIESCYERLHSESDMLQHQRELRQLIGRLKTPTLRIVMVIDRVDDIYHAISPSAATTLRQLRDQFRRTVCYVVASEREVNILASQRALGSFFSLFDARVCQVGALDDETMVDILAEELQSFALTSDQLWRLVYCIGGYMALLDPCVNWWRHNRPDPDDLSWVDELYDLPAIQRRLDLLWSRLTSRERSVLADLELIKPARYERFQRQHRRQLVALGRAGLCQRRNGRWHIASELLRTHMMQVRHTIRGEVWFNEKDDTFYQGEEPLETLSPRAEAALEFFLGHPYKKCEKDQLIYHIWDSPHVTDDSVYQVIRELRRHIEPDTNNPCYIINHRGLRGGRYQFFPAGKQKRPLA